MSHDSPHASSRSEDNVLATPEETDPEVPKPIKAIKLQHDLSVLFDQDGHDHLLAHFDAQANNEPISHASKTYATKQFRRNGFGPSIPGHD